MQISDLENQMEIEQTNDQEIPQNNVIEIDSDSAMNSKFKYKQNNQNSKNKKISQIEVQRLSQRIKTNNGIFWSGYMMYYSSSSIQVYENLAFLIIYI
jgi:hypothetical protein